MYFEYHEKLGEMENKLWSLQSDAYDTLDLDERLKDEISIRLYVARKIIQDIDEDLIAENAVSELEESD